MVTGPLGDLLRLLAFAPKIIDRIASHLFDRTPDERHLVLSRAGPGRPLPPRRGGKRKKAWEGGAGNPRLFDMD